MRVLIIEDHIDLANSMKSGLEQFGFSVDTANNGEDGEGKTDINKYDVILLDLNLPDKDGIEILKNIRKSGKEVPIIIVSARDELEQRTSGLDLGADDYITKPFEIPELRARIQAIIRRFQGRTNPLIQIGKLQINPAKREVYYGSYVVTLKPKEFDLLEYLAGRHPAVVSAEELVEHIYDENFDPFSSVLRVHLTRLRKKLYEASGEEILITIRGKGYYLCEK